MRLRLRLRLLPDADDEEGKMGKGVRAGGWGLKVVVLPVMMRRVRLGGKRRRNPRRNSVDEVVENALLHVVDDDVADDDDDEEDRPEIGGLRRKGICADCVEREKEI